MQNVVHSPASPVKGVQVGQVGLVELDLGPGTISTKFSRFPVEKLSKPRTFRPRQKLPRQGRSDKPRNASNQISCHGISIIQVRPGETRGEGEGEGEGEGAPRFSFLPC